MACGESMADSIHMNGLQGPTPMVVDNDEITPEMRSSAEDEKDKGNQCYKEKDYNKAISHYSKAIDLCPDDARYYTNRSAAKMMILKYKDALNDAQLAIKLDNAFAKAYLREAKCHIALGNAQAALLSLQKAKEIDPSTHHAVMTEVQHANSLTNYEQQSEQAFKSKDYRQVEYYMRRATAIAPACVGYKIQQAESLALMGKYKEAQDIALDVLRSDRMNADAVYIRALCMYYDDDIDKAVNFFTHALKLSPDHSGARSTLKKAKQLARKKSEGNDAFKSNRTQQAYDLYSEALAIDENNRKTNAKLFCNRALVGGKLGKWEEAASDCTKAIDLDSDYVKAYQRRAKCYSRLEKYDEAVYDYKKAYDLDRTRENKRALQEAEAELKRSKRKDYYKILGVEKNATDDQIKKAYRKQALVYHPDRHAHATDSEKETAEHKFKEVGEAYSVLTDENKRARYDRGEDLDGPSGLQDIDPNNIFQMFFGGGGGPGMQFSQGGHGHGNAGGGFPGGFHFQFG